MQGGVSDAFTTLPLTGTLVSAGDVTFSQVIIVPTLGDWGLVILVTAVLGAGVFQLHRRRRLVAA